MSVLYLLFKRYFILLLYFDMNIFIFNLIAFYQTCTKQYVIRTRYIQRSFSVSTVYCKWDYLKHMRTSRHYLWEASNGMDILYHFVIILFRLIILDLLYDCKTSSRKLHKSLSNPLPVSNQCWCHIRNHGCDRM